MNAKCSLVLLAVCATVLGCNTRSTDAESVEKRGVSVRFGVTVASLDPSADPAVRLLPPGSERSRKPLEGARITVTLEDELLIETVTGESGEAEIALDGVSAEAAVVVTHESCYGSSTPIVLFDMLAEGAESPLFEIALPCGPNVNENCEFTAARGGA